MRFPVLLLLLLALCCSSCVATATDLQGLEGRITARLQSEATAPLQVVKEETARSVEQIQQRVQAVAQGVVSPGSALGASGVVGLLWAIALNLYRNQTRQADIRRALASAAQPPGAVGS